MRSARLSFDVLLADPPWPQRKGGLRKLYPNQKRSLDYPVLSLPDIEEILSKIDAPVLFLWTIDKFLFEAQAIAEHLGYKLHARLIWDKTNGVAPAFTVRFAHEYLLWMYRSPMPKIAHDMRGKFTTVFREPSKRHSQKPVCAYEMIEKLYPDCSRLELFARQKRSGWSVWGNEVESDITIPLSGGN
jgi:N6-adenosine-specific RNA methylase IME4